MHKSYTVTVGEYRYDDDAGVLLTAGREKYASPMEEEMFGIVYTVRLDTGEQFTVPSNWFKQLYVLDEDDLEKLSEE